MIFRVFCSLQQSVSVAFIEAESRDLAKEKSSYLLAQYWQVDESYLDIYNLMSEKDLWQRSHEWTDQTTSISDLCLFELIWSQDLYGKRVQYLQQLPLLLVSQDNARRLLQAYQKLPITQQNVERTT